MLLSTMARWSWTTALTMSAPLRRTTAEVRSDQCHFRLTGGVSRLRRRSARTIFGTGPATTRVESPVPGRVAVIAHTTRGRKSRGLRPALVFVGDDRTAQPISEAGSATPAQPRAYRLASTVDPVAPRRCC